MSSLNASSGMSKRVPVSASATSTGSVPSKLAAAGVPELGAASLTAATSRLSWPLACSSWAALVSGGRSPSPMSSMRRANAYTAASERRLAGGSSLMP